MIPNLSDAQVTLTPLLESDISQEYLDSLNDPNHMKYSRNVTYFHTFASQIEYITKFKNSFNLLFGVKQTNSGKLLGSITCYIDFYTSTLDLGFLIFKNYQGKGYATRSLRLLIRYLESQFPGMTVVIGSHKDNLAMHKVAVNLDFQEVRLELPDQVANLKFVKKLSKFNSLSQPGLPHFMLKAKKIGVAAHDAGGAEQVSWLLKNVSKKIFAYVEGPAIKIFEKAGVDFEKCYSLNKLIECDLVITGSGWMSDLENKVIRKCEDFKVPCITLLDHWVNYEERFMKEPQANPRMFAVTNLPALQIASLVFPNQPIWLLPDHQVESYKSIIVRSSQNRDVLVLLEPSPALSNDFSITEELERLLIRSAFELKEKRNLDRVVMRLHPSDDPTNPKYLNFQAEFPDVYISTRTNLVEDLVLAAVVLGFSTYGLYISAMCGIDTRSYFVGASNHWTSQFKATIRTLDQL